MALSKLERRARVRRRIRRKVFGTSLKPRLSVFRSNRQIYAQVIDDNNGITLLSACSREKSIASRSGIKKSEQASLVGKLLASKCREKGIQEVVFDRGGYKYHGRVKSLADGAREGGLKF